MIEHPVPQNITSYEFRLVGSMTLKQFFELMVGIVLAFVIYRTNLYPLIKWPLVISSVVFGVSLAFVPIQERPLDQWFMAFIRAIYNPTKFYWRRSLQTPEVFTNESVNLTKYQDEEKALSAAVSRKRSRASAYLETLGTAPAAASIETEDDLRASGILALFDEVRVPAQTVQAIPQKPTEETSKPDLELKPRSLKTKMHLEEDRSLELNAPTLDSASQKDLHQLQPVRIPEQIPVVLSGEDVESSNLTKDASAVSYARQSGQVSVIPLRSQIPAGAPAASGLEVVRSESHPFPNPPKQPNVLAGMVLDSSGKLLENAIIEVRSEQGVPVRAIKSNKLGQFFTSSPLPQGTYQMIIEKSGYRFEPQRLTVQNSVIPPLEIRANQAVQ